MLHSITLLPLDLACRMAGLIYAHLRKMIGESDILIAGIVKHNKEMLVRRIGTFSICRSA
ncbi:MAG: hypothetical protein QXL44_02535 [Candidatus Nitrosocaldus sp.]